MEQAALQLIPLDAIKIPAGRFRKEFEPAALADLTESIRTDGLLHPIILRPKGDREFELVAGERRLRAVQQLAADYRHNDINVQRGFIPFTTTGQILDPAAARIQVNENVRRMDFTWQERAEAFAALHKLRLEETGGLQPKSRTVGEIMKSRMPNNNDVAELTASLNVADHLDDPEVVKAKSLREAEAIVTRRKQIVLDAEKARLVQAEVAQSRHKLHHSSCELALPRMADGLFDVIIADPLYGINAHKHAAVSTSDSAYRHDYDDSPEAAEAMWFQIVTSGFRIARPKAHLYIFHDFTKWSILSAFATAAGWMVWPRPIIWDKGSGGMIGDYRHGPSRTYESILYAIKGEKEVTGVYQEVIRLPSNADTTLNAAAKPVEVYVDLLRRSARPGDHVLDPCCGTAPLFPAANRLNLYATGVEASEALYNFGLGRLNEQ